MHFVLIYNLEQNFTNRMKVYFLMYVRVKFVLKLEYYVETFAPCAVSEGLKCGSC